MLTPSSAEARAAHERRVTRALAQIFAAAVLGCVALVVYAFIAEYRGEAAAKAFCATLEVGGSTNGLVDRAERLGAEKRYLKWRVGQNEFEKDAVAVVFTGATPLSRHACSIQAKHQRIVSFDYFAFD